MRCLKVAGSSHSAVVASPPPALCGCRAAHGQRAGTFTPGSHCLLGMAGKSTAPALPVIAAPFWEGFYCPADCSGEAAQAFYTTRLLK